MRTSIAIIALVAGLAGPSQAYKVSPCLVRSAGFSVAMKNPLNSAGMADFGLECHAANPDDSLIPKSWQSVIAPETWAAGVGIGGDLHGAAVVQIELTANVAPMLATSLMHFADESQPTIQGQAKAWLLGKGSTAFRIGGGLAPSLIYNGHFQSLAAAFPGRGFFDIMANIARVNVGLAW